MLELLETEEQYESCLKRIYLLMQMVLQVNSSEFEELEFLSILVQNYEQVHHEIRSRIS